MRCALVSYSLSSASLAIALESTSLLYPSGQNLQLYGRPKDESHERETENDPKRETKTQRKITDPQNYDKLISSAPREKTE